MAKSGLVPKFSMSVLINELDNLDSKVYRQVVQKAAMFASTPMVTTAREKLRKSGRIRTGLLRKSLGKVKRTYKKEGFTLVLVGARRGFKTPIGRVTRGKYRGARKYANPEIYAHLVNAGFNHYRGPRVRGAHFMEAAGDAKEKVMARMHLKLDREIEKEIVKAFKKAGI